MSCCTSEKPKRMTMSFDSSIFMPRKKCKKCTKCTDKEVEQRSLDLKKIVLLPLFVLLSTASVWAQNTTAPKTFWDDPFTHPNLQLYMVGVLGFITFIMVIVVTLYAFKIVKIFAEEAEKERAKRLGIVYKPTPGWWETTWQRANAMVPLTEEKSIEMDHDFDGIRELDNNLPPWWKMLFVATVIWSVIYIGVYHVFNSLPLSLGEYENEITQAEEQARIFRASQPTAVIDENTLIFTEDAAIIAKGKAVFEGSCIACHRMDGGGNAIGPNLTDAYWLHGGGIKNVYVTIKNGVVEKGMPAWGKSMSPQDVRDVSFYVLSIQGTNPKEAKAAQGVEYKEEPVVKADSIKTQAMVAP